MLPCGGDERRDFLQQSGETLAAERVADVILDGTPEGTGGVESFLTGRGELGDSEAAVDTGSDADQPLAFKWQEIAAEGGAVHDQLVGEDGQ
jgi:hypothetical protein